MSNLLGFSVKLQFEGERLRLVKIEADGSSGRDLKAAEENGTLTEKRAKIDIESKSTASDDSIDSGDRRLLKGLVDKLSWEEEKN